MAPVSTGAGYVDVPVSNTRAIIAKRLLESKVTIPHYYLTVDINVDKLTALRAKFNKNLEKDGVKLSFNDFVVKATALASKKVPEANSSWHGSFIRMYVVQMWCDGNVCQFNFDLSYIFFNAGTIQLNVPLP